jgi:hypothetical protein
MRITHKKQLKREMKLQKILVHPKMKGHKKQLKIKMRFQKILVLPKMIIHKTQ